MTPDQILTFVESTYPTLRAERRENPNGWAFFLGHPVRGPVSNRIFRALQCAETASSMLKLSITSRLTSSLELRFRGDEIELGLFIDRELKLYYRNFCSTTSEYEA